LQETEKRRKALQELEPTDSQLNDCWLPILPQSNPDLEAKTAIMKAVVAVQIDSGV